MDIRLSRQRNVPIVVESCGYEGVRRIAHKVAEDIEKVIGSRPEVIAEDKLCVGQASCIILCATLGQSKLLDRLIQENKVDCADLYGKWEVYQIKLIQTEDFSQILLICGSDKRGTIYGMFSLSEYIGISPLCFWGDVVCRKQEEIVIKSDIEKISKEPSVRYRGFFINDEWPCFGHWVTERFGGFCADAYEHIFELLLRLKGNYLWPAMWTASFPLDGPGNRNEELADIYGVVIGYSHHEPCLRASEEWDKVRGVGSRYGNEWNFYTNREGLLNYWEDALKRSGGYENIITIGMRGERDSSMLGDWATVAENIELLKDIIVSQKKLIKKYVNREEQEIPLLLALYKEVEAYFYGDSQTPGLKDWEELADVIYMLCEDNYGYMRTLPEEKLRSHKGGFGMYYHLDYHGAPISYEWVDSTPLSKIWEQMGEAYEYGINKVWMVNVGDLKFHEIPLFYFMALAYDYDRWGYGNPDSYREFTKEWTKCTFPEVNLDVQKEIGQVLTDYIQINSLRRPEALHTGIYHPCHYNETDRMILAAEQIEERSNWIWKELTRQEDRQAYYSMIHFPAMASANLLKMHLYAGKNNHYAKQGRIVANDYAEYTLQCIERDKELSQEWEKFLEGKWNGMQLACHIGFTKWNDDDYRYPVLMSIKPTHKPKMSVSRKDEERIAVKNYGSPTVIQVPDFQYVGCDRVVLEIANGGVGSFHYKINMEDKLPKWLTITPIEGEVEVLEEVQIMCHRELLPAKAWKFIFQIQGEDTCVNVEIIGKAIPALEGKEKEQIIFPNQYGCIVIEARDFCNKKDTKKGSYQIIEDYGKYGCGLKVFPSTAVFEADEKKPEVTYSFYVEEEGEYCADILTAPSNSLVYGQSMRIIAGLLEDRMEVQILPADFRAGDCSDIRWSKAALDQEHRTKVRFYAYKGIQRFAIGAMDAGVVIERIVIYRQDAPIKEAYLGPSSTI